MKKFVIFSLLVLSLNSLYAMKEGGTLPGFSFANLPDELLCMIARFARPDQEPIAPRDAVQDVREYSFPGTSHGVYQIVWLPDGARIAWVDCSSFLDSFLDGRRVKTIDLISGKKPTVYTDHHHACSVSLSPDGRWLASGGSDGVLKIFDAVTGKTQAEHVKKGLIESVDWSSDGACIALGLCWKGRWSVEIVDAATGSVQVDCKCDHALDVVALSRDGTHVALGSRDCSGGARLQIADAVTGLQAEHVFNAENSGVRSWAWSPDGARVAMSSDSILILDAVTWSVQAKHSLRHSMVYSMDWSPDGQYIVSGWCTEPGPRFNLKGKWGTVKIFDPATCRTLAKYEHDQHVETVAYSPNGLYVASVDAVGTVKVKSVVPLLLATHQLEHPTLSQYLLLKRLQEKLFREKEPLLIGQSDHSTLEEMPELKKLLRIDRSKSETQNPIWCLQLNGSGAPQLQGGGQPAAHAGDRLSADPEEEEQGGRASHRDCAVQ